MKKLVLKHTALYQRDAVKGEEIILINSFSVEDETTANQGEVSGFHQTVSTHTSVNEDFHCDKRVECASALGYFRRQVSHKHFTYNLDPSMEVFSRKVLQALGELSLVRSVMPGFFL